jgi:O-antigen/teichoic acid export membrane protein
VNFRLSHWLGRLRRDKRLSLILSAGLYGLLAKAVGFAAIFFVANVCYQKFGAAQYGMLVTIQSLSLALAFADLGLGSGLVSSFIKFKSSGDTIALRGIINGVAAAVGSLALFFGLTIILLSPLIAKFLLRSTDDFSVFEIQSGILLVGAQISIQMYFGIAQRVNFALQRNYVNHLYAIAGNVVQMILVYLFAKLNVGFVWLVFAVTLPPSLQMIVNYSVTFGVQNPDVMPELMKARKSDIAAALKVGLIYLLINIFGLLAFVFDAMLLTAFAAPVLAGIFALHVRLFQLINNAIDPFTQALWPAFQDAADRGDAVWSRSIFNRGILLVFSVSLGIALLLAFGYKYFLGILIPLDAQQDLAQRWGFAVWAIVAGVASVIIAVLSTRKFVRVLLNLTIASAVSSLALKWFFLKMGLTGGAAVFAWINALVSFLIIVVPGFFIITRKKT